MRLHRLGVLALTAAVAGGFAAAAAVPDPVDGTDRPAVDEVDDAENALRAHGRLQDQYTNPAFHRALALEAPEQFVAGVSDQAEHPDRPMLTLSQTIYGG